MTSIPQKFRKINTNEVKITPEEPAIIRRYLPFAAFFSMSTDYASRKRINNAIAIHNWLNENAAGAWMWSSDEDNRGVVFFEREQDAVMYALAFSSGVDS